MADWLFKANLEHYDLMGRLSDPHPDLCWVVRQHASEIARGDRAFLWVSLPKGGLVGAAEIVSDPHESSPSEFEHRYFKSMEIKAEPRVEMKLMSRISEPIPKEELASIPGLERMCIFHGRQQGTNFSVTRAEGDILLGLLRQRESQ